MGRKVTVTRDDSTMRAKAQFLSSALPYMQKYENQTIVIKYGGNAMGDQALHRAFARDIALLKQSGLNPVVVHGGGPQIDMILQKMGIKSHFKRGLRVTDKDAIAIVEMVLSGLINKEIAASINAEGEWAIGLSGKDGHMVFAEKLTAMVKNEITGEEELVDWGFVGEPVEVDRQLLDILTRSAVIPVIAPIARGRDGATYNINADIFAGAIAGATFAKRLLFLTNVPGVLDKNGKIMSVLKVEQAQQLIADGIISGGMIPKVETCISALRRGAEGVVIMDGTTPHGILLELFSEQGAGTLIVP